MAASAEEAARPWVVALGEALAIRNPAKRAEALRVLSADPRLDDPLLSASLVTVHLGQGVVIHAPPSKLVIGVARARALFEADRLSDALKTLAGLPSGSLRSLAEAATSLDSGNPEPVTAIGLIVPADELSGWLALLAVRALRLCSRLDDAAEQLDELLRWRDLPADTRVAARVEEADLAMLAGDIPLAASILSEVLGTDPDNPAARLLNDLCNSRTHSDDSPLTPDILGGTCGGDVRGGELGALRHELRLLLTELREEQGRLGEFSARRDALLGPRLVRRNELERALDDFRGREGSLGDREPDGGVDESPNVRSAAADTMDGEARCADLPGLGQSKSVAQHLKSLYRRLCKQLHPDLASNEAERQRRDELMKRLNDAYEHDDVEAVRDVEDQLLVEETDGQLGGGDIPAHRRHLKERIAVAAARLARLRESDDYGLMHRVEEEARNGIDLLEEIAADLDAEIQSLEQILETRDADPTGEPA
jgi:hypothetical protein